jgi:hypothetical protein
MKIIKHDEISLIIENDHSRYEITDNEDGSITIHSTGREKNIINIIPNANNSITVKSTKYR